MAMGKGKVLGRKPEESIVCPACDLSVVGSADMYAPGYPSGIKELRFRVKR